MPDIDKPVRVVIMGAAGRDFHNFNMFFRGNPAYEVVAFTAAQIPDIAGRAYPPELAGPGYPQGIPIIPEEDLPNLVASARQNGRPIEQIVFSYSDVSFDYVMDRGSVALALDADFRLLGPGHTMLKAHKPVVAVTAVRTGAGKSQTTRRVAEILTAAGRRVVVVRHPMPYGDLRRQVVQRFQTYEDLDRYECTVEEREEYEPHLARGNVVYAGVDYELILQRAEQEADIILWDGGNNDVPFFAPDLWITVVDPHRPGHELSYFPGEVNLLRANVVVINKIDTAQPDNVAQVRENIRRRNPGAVVIEAASPVSASDPQLISGRRVLVVEDGPTLTHGGMAIGAGVVAARKWGASMLVEPRPYAVGTVAEALARYPQTTLVLPAVGYSGRQIRDLEETINRVPADVVVVATPIDLGRLVRVGKPMVRVRYELQEIGRPSLGDVILPWLSTLPGQTPVPKPNWVAV